MWAADFDATANLPDSGNLVQECQYVRNMLDAVAAVNLVARVVSNWPRPDG
jgi:hypothetical protein